MAEQFVIPVKKILFYSYIPVLLLSMHGQARADLYISVVPYTKQAITCFDWLVGCIGV